MEIIFKGRQTDVPVRFREYATAKLSKLERLDQKAIRVDVEVSVERNPRLSSQKERVELTIRSRGPAIRAEAAAEDRMAALDLALGKLDSRLRRAADRRKSRHGGHVTDRPADWRLAEAMITGEDIVMPGEVTGGGAGAPAGANERTGGVRPEGARSEAARAEGDSVVPIDMEGDGPLVVRQKFHRSDPITIDQALLEMELVGHDFYLFHDVDSDLPSVVYRRRGYQYGVIRLIEKSAGHGAPGRDGANAGRESEADLPRGAGAASGTGLESGGLASDRSIPGRQQPEPSGGGERIPAPRRGKASSRA